MKKNTSTKETNGITLIALVITIVILIILASVSITMSLSNIGIFDRAKQAKVDYRTATNEEEKMSTQLVNDVNFYSSSTQSILGSARGPLETRVLYPGGTAENPPTITNNQRIVIDNPFLGHRVMTIVEIQYNGLWGEPGFIYSSGGPGGYGIKASQLTGENVDSIVIQSGSKAITTYSESGGNSFGAQIKNPTSMQYRIWVYCID